MKRRWSILVGMVVVALSITLAPIALAAPRAAPSTSSTIIHIVRPGETLSGIARYYGVNVWALARDNNIINPNPI